MRRTLTLTSAALLLALTGCSSAASTTGSSDAATPTTGTSPASSATTSVTVSSKAVATSGDLTATTAMALLTAKVPTAKLTGVITENNDGNNLIGRPHQYTSKVTFKDSRISAGDTVGFKAGDLEFGGAVEVFGTPADATARAKYIQAVTASIPALAEYDYVHGTVLVRVSHFLKPSQAKGYEQAVGSIG
ncbi:hypothetical protein ABUW04_12430 [Streptacidiphilus sp. N1-10]|uniref:Lipoprotein n=1 Tax=Streptacidiphilus jeojiensis TaxID=3229225 RepID=A0ABV6XLH6_9ACTN